jgi:DNA-binding NarL/FixJ family response regulator
LPAPGDHLLLRLLIADQHPFLREALEAILRRQFPTAEISTVESHNEAHDAVLRQPADLLLTDLFCCRAGDSESFVKLVESVSPGRVIVVGQCPGPANVRLAKTAGAHGYLPPSSRPELVAAAIGLVLSGGVYFPDPVSLDQRSTSETGRRLVDRLSRRQRDVLRGLQAGQSNKAIARALGISVATVKLHVQAIFRQTGAHNRTEAVALTADQSDDPAKRE